MLEGQAVLLQRNRPEAALAAHVVHPAHALTAPPVPANPAVHPLVVARMALGPRGELAGPGE
jgi:hypothetical protein